MAPVALSCDVAILLILEQVNIRTISFFSFDQSIQNIVINAAKLYLDPTASLKAPRLVCRLFYTLANRFFFRKFKMHGSVISKSILHQILSDGKRTRLQYMVLGPLDGEDQYPACRTGSGQDARAKRSQV